jgi:Lactonase, 7-bladed beta-propeller
MAGSIMKIIARVAGAGLAALASAAAFSAEPASATTTEQTSPVFVQSDNPNGNTVVAYHREADGTLTQSGVYATGGLGGVAAGSVVDHLTSQGSLAYDGSAGLLYAVNAGSGTITVFRGNGDSADVFPVSLLGPAAKPIVYTKAGSASFGFTFDANGHLVLTEAGPNDVATFTVPRNGRLTQIDEVATGQAGTCWVVRDGDFVYASNAGSGTLSRYQVGGTGSLTARGQTATDAGTVDAAVSSDGRDIYVQTGANGIVDEFRVNADGSLTRIGSVTVPDAVGGEGIAAA